jgi:hypothetical protein
VAAAPVASAAGATAAAQLGHLRHQSIEQTRVLAGVTGTITLPPNLLAQCGGVMSQHSSTSAQSAAPDYGTQAGHSGPYVEEHFADGVVIYRFSGGSVVAPPDAAAYYCAYMVSFAEVPRADPPAIPADNSPQAKWARWHNQQLRDVIAKLVSHDDAKISRIDQAADATTHGDLFQTTDFLTGVADFYAGNAP